MKKTTEELLLDLVKGSSDATLQVNDEGSIRKRTEQKITNAIKELSTRYDLDKKYLIERVYE